MTKSPLHFISLLFIFIFFVSCSSNRRSASKYRGYSKYSYANKSKKRSRHRKRTKDFGVERRSIVAEAYKYKGIKYKYGGKKPSNGFDCSGFSTFVLNKQGYNISGSSRQLSKMGNLREENKIQPGDLAFFGSNGNVSHVAIVISKSDKEFKVIHSTSSKGVMVSDLTTSPYWKSIYLFTRDVISKV